MTWITTEGGVPIITEDTGRILIVEGPSPSLQSIIPAYPYFEYADDPNICAFFTAYNILAQAYLDWFNQTPLAVYTQPTIDGPLLDWVGQGIYGITRPVFASFVTQYLAGVNSFPVNTQAVNGRRFKQSGTATTATDDFYKRVLTWFNYVGNGRYFNVQVLRWKVARFIYGANGTDVTLQQQATIHILSGLLSPPPAPTLSYVAGGSLPATKYGARSTYVTPRGETIASPATVLSVPANNLLVVDSPPDVAGAEGWNTYVAEIGTLPARFLAGVNSFAVNTQSVNGTNAPPINWQKQNLTPIDLGTNWTEPTSGLINGGPLPTQNTSNTDTNLIITVPAGLAATYFKDAFEQGLLAFPFQLSGDVVIAA